MAGDEHTRTRSVIPLAAALAVRAAFVALSILTSFYGVLAYIPDTYIAFIQAPFQPWLPAMIRLQPLLFSICAAALAVTLWRESSGSPARTFVVEFLLFLAAAAVYLWIARPLPKLETHAISFVWALALLFPVLWLGVVDWKLYWERVAWPTVLEPSFRLSTALLIGTAMGIGYPAAIYARYALGRRATLPSGTELAVWALTLLAHILFFGFVFGVGMAVEAVASRLRAPAKARFVMLTASAGVGLALFFARAILPFIPFLGVEPGVYSVMIAGALATLGSGALLLIKAGRGQRAPVPISVRELALLTLVLLVAAVEVPAMLGIFDWNAILEKFWVVVLWSAVSAVVVRFLPHRPERLSTVAAFAVPSFACLAYFLIFSTRLWSAPDSRLYRAMEQPKSEDISYAVVVDLFAGGHELPCDELCRFLKQQSNITQAVETPELRLVENMRPKGGPLPNLFIVVVDSLRQDVVAPYAISDADTPEIARFATDSVVFRNAFTRYAGTTLSEPAIWAGGMLLHKHYTQPFSRVNNLERLIVTEQYQSYVSLDTTLRMLLHRTPGMVPLDSRLMQWTELDLCHTTDELNTNLARRDLGRPVFFYSQPQNMHVISVKRHHLNSLDLPQEKVKQAYLGELRHVDACFGRFLNALKQNGLYDDSVIVLTADHGEFGHDSHAFSLESAIIKVPLIVHLPERMKKDLYFDPERVAFTTDITPTLYYLTGHRDIRNDELFGRPLFTATREEAARYDRDSYLLVSTYEPVYGVLRDNGRRLFITDEVKGKTFLYDLAADPGSDHNQISSTPIGDSRERIRAHVQHIAQSYNFRYKEPTLIDWLQR